MGPTLFRKHLKKNEWNFKFAENNKEESSLLFYKNLQIENYLQKLLNVYGLFIMTLKIEYSISQFKIIIGIFNSNNKRIKKDLSNINYIINTKLLITLQQYYI